MGRALLISALMMGGGAALGACSSDHDSAAGAGGGGATAGAAGSGATAGADGVTVLAQGNLTLSVHRVSPASCPVAGRTYLVGNPKGPTAITPGDRLLDGEQGTTIQCSVLGNGAHTFSGAIAGTSSEGEAVTLRITNGVVNEDRTTGTATIEVSTPQLANTFRSAEGGCQVHVVQDNVKPGSIWATFSCASIAEPGTGQVCGIGVVSTFVFENCEGS